MSDSATSSGARRMVPDDDAMRELGGGVDVQVSDAGVQRFIPADAEVSIPPANARAKARIDGFDLDAAVSVSRRKRDKLERLARYILRPAISSERLSILDDGRVVLALKRVWPDGSTHVVFMEAITPFRGDRIARRGGASERKSRRAPRIPARRQ